MGLQFNTSRYEILSALTILQNIAGKKGTIAILSNILIETGIDELCLTATDLEVGVQLRFPAEILSPGALTLPAKKLFEIVKESAGDEVKIEEQENNWVSILIESSAYKLAGMASEEFPAFPEYTDNNFVALQTEVLKELIDKTIFSVALEGESQFTLAGILFEKDSHDEKKYIRMISSDGHRLSLMEKQAPEDIDILPLESTVIIPKKGMQEMRKFCELQDTVSLGIEDKKAIIKGDNGVMIIRLMNGEFPNYRNIMETVNKDKYIEFNRIQLLSSMKRMNLFTEDIFSIVKFNIGNNVLILNSQSMDLGSAKDEIAISYEGENLTIGFNGKYFVDSLSVMKSENVKAFINNSESPCLIQGDKDEGFISMIMPMEM